MKIITLVPVKNEAWILPYSLENFSTFSDYIIVADQNSTDDTANICARFNKVTVIKNPYTAHTNQIRWLLLDEARKIPGDNLIVYLDADELLSPDSINDIKERTQNENRAVGISTEWIQLIKTYDEYRIDGVWKNNYKQFAFYDDRLIDYDRTTITNDHSNRIPTVSNIVTINHPILHLQYLAKKRSEIKQIFYMCTELLQGINPRKINNRYSVARLSGEIKTAHTPPIWYKNITLPPLDVFKSEDLIKKKQVVELLETKGFQYFESLDIWRDKEIESLFIKRVGRKPKIMTFPKLITKINDLKNMIKNAILTKL